ncbi:Ku protein [soil metagenome]
MRAIWTGTISFSLVSIPVKIYSAVDASKGVSFRQLHKEDHAPVGYQKVSKKSGKVLDNDEIVRGFEYEPDQYVIVEDEELNNLKLESTKTIEIEAFVPASEIDLALFDQPYLMGPSSEPAVKPYELLRQAMEDESMVAIGRVVMQTRERVIGIRPSGRGLMAYQLRYPDELRSLTDAPLVEESAEVDQSQLKLAKQLIGSMTQPFGELELKDRYQDAVMDLVKAKVEGREVITVDEEPEREEAPDIMTALEESIKRMKSDNGSAKKSAKARKDRKPAKSA